MTVASIVRTARRARKLTYKQVAEQSGMSVQVAWNIETGRTRNPSIYHCLRLCATLGIRLELLVADALMDNMRPDEPPPPERVCRRLQQWTKWNQDQPTTRGESHAQ